MVTYLYMILYKTQSSSRAPGNKGLKELVRLAYKFLTPVYGHIEPGAIYIVMRINIGR